MFFLSVTVFNFSWLSLTFEIALQGEEQKKLDVLSNEVFVKALVSSGRTVMHSLHNRTRSHVPSIKKLKKSIKASFLNF
jgi:hypothetical protein